MDETNNEQSAQSVDAAVTIEANIAKPDGSYGTDQIRVLEGLEAVRKRPAMYIGDTFERGYHHCVYEAVDNSIDEAMAGYCSHIDIILGKDGSCTVKDNGRGIPVGMKELSNGVVKPTLEVVLTQLHAGGKFGDGGYKVSGGLHGVGVKCVNALSEWMEVEVRREGKIHRIAFSRGEVTSPFAVVGDANDTGTTISFKLDNEIFFKEGEEEGGPREYFSFKWDILSKRLKELSFLNPGVTIRFTDERDGRHEEYYHKNGIIGFVESVNSGKNPLCPIISLTGAQKASSGVGMVAVDVALQYIAGKDTESIYTFANNINTHEGGTHLAGLRMALSREIKKYIDANKLDKKAGDKKYEFASEDFTQGITCVISVKVPEPQFEGQTKTKLGNSDCRKIVSQVAGDELKKYLDENPTIGKALAEKAIRARDTRIKVAAAIDNIKKENSSSGIHFLGKLAECSSKKREECELFIVEGDSAGGSAKKGRDRTRQAILPLRGKVLNVERASIEKMLENNEIKSLISAIGGGFGDYRPVGEGATNDTSDVDVEPEENSPNATASSKNVKKNEKIAFDVSKIRYNKIVIMTDADVDGAHIRTLLLTFFYRCMRPLIEHGHVYIAQPPLYQIKHGKKGEYVESDAELTSKLIKIGAEQFSYTSADETMKIESTSMPSILETLAAAESICNRLRKQNIDLKRYFEARKPETGDFPNYRVITDVDGNPQEHYVFTIEESMALKREVSEKLECNVEELDDLENPNYNSAEIRQSNELRRLMSALHNYGFKLGDFLGNEETELGSLCDEKGQKYPIKSLLELLDVVRTRGKKGLTIQRYKGLGEMDADQLYETTMDPVRRKMKRAVLENSEESEKIFSMLMGDEVGPRRKFIEENALLADVDA